MTQRRIAQGIVEGVPGVRWWFWKIITVVIFRSAFAELGPGSVIVAPRTLRGIDRIRIGSRCAIYAGAWLQCESDAGSITIGDGANFINAIHIHAADPITIGRNAVFGSFTTVISAEHTEGDRSGYRGSGPITIGDNVLVGERATILGGVTIGDDATIGAGAVVTRDVPAGSCVGGVPAKPLRARVTQAPSSGAGVS